MRNQNSENGAMRRSPIFPEKTRVGFDGSGQDGHRNRQKGTVRYVDWDEVGGAYRIIISPDNPLYAGQVIETTDMNRGVTHLNEDDTDPGLQTQSVVGNNSGLL